MKIISLDQAGTGAELGLQPNDELLRINGQRVRDIIDYRFLIAAEEVVLEIRRQGETIIYEIEKDQDDSLGVNFEPLKIRGCGNDCVFCFVDQNPSGMRRPLYFRDEDFRLSFLAGHYVTLSNISQADLRRIVQQRLSPLFISVHATDPAVRRFLLGITFDDRLPDKITYLTQHGIVLHTQIVLCPGINDGAVLDKTLRDLAKFYPAVRSVALVPVGLTKHRQGLTPIQPVTGEYARQTLHLIDRYAAEFRPRLGSHFVYAADEFYILARQPLPPTERYDAFDQMENGVGMLRDLLNNFHQRQIRRLPRVLAQPARVTLVTATLAGGFLQENIMPRLAQIKNFTAELVVVENKFYGESITVSGLLTGRDIHDALAGRDLGAAVFLPKNCLNDNHVFLDDWKLLELSQRLAVPVVPLANDFSQIFPVLAGRNASRSRRPPGRKATATVA
ncbi:MAG: DUF512 domain-containing protein [candidate division KSB1 bacterium]|nr:DUF512 domain-containing protein [candidate division KSB1 bacterium]MDZ7273804.1 DUF512 domain-containing protein [candidate division KSB1 bacterium]MDZ7285960.1 DUF512 domain-containing protein [candidate division KSB1 bacterium]MDZ7298992.1 DUF512 domain-containing protein [candidate division KSB1 bacterium]MDZ7309216.1 DUF512 domain-containing protein [candidate division KSB1 bacterium]